MSDPALQGTARPLSAEEYESYVASVVSRMEAFEKASITRNKRMPGVRQPGTYEIDIAVEFSMAGILNFLVIIECKNWNRPVDRPIVQKLIQTAEAVGAQKAAVVSPLGFTAEAVAVARAHHVALWVLAQEEFRSVVAYETRSREASRDCRPAVYQMLRRELLYFLRLSPKVRHTPSLVDWLSLDQYPVWREVRLQTLRMKDENNRESWLHRLPAFQVENILSGLDNRLATAQVFFWLEEQIKICIDHPEAVNWVNAMGRKLRELEEFDLADPQLDIILHAVLEHNSDVFRDSLANQAAEKLLWCLVLSAMRG